MTGRIVRDGAAKGNGAPRAGRVTSSLAFRTRLREALCAEVDAHGPAYADVVRARVAGHLGLKVTARLVRALDGLPHDRRSTSEDGRTLLWPHGVEPCAHVPFRPPAPGTRRVCADVPMAELVDLARQVADHRARGSQRAMSSALGHRTLHPGVVARLERALRLSEELGLHVTPPHPVTSGPRSRRRPPVGAQRPTVAATPPGWDAPEARSSAARP